MRISARVPRLPLISRVAGLIPSAVLRRIMDRTTAVSSCRSQPQIMQATALFCSSARRILNRPPLKSGAWDESVVWFGLEPATASSAASFPCPAPQTGYFRLGDEESWALIRAGQYTRRPFQADQLHVDLWWRGLNIARDPGTYLYNGPAPWNNAFAGSAVHNIVTVDGQDQMTRAGRFLWLDWSQASGRVFARESSARANCFEGEHNGYRDSV